MVQYIRKQNVKIQAALNNHMTYSKSCNHDKVLGSKNPESFVCSSTLS